MLMSRLYTLPISFLVGFSAAAACFQSGHSCHSFTSFFKMSPFAHVIRTQTVSWRKVRACLVSAMASRWPPIAAPPPPPPPLKLDILAWSCLARIPCRWECRRQRRSLLGAHGAERAADGAHHVGADHVRGKLQASVSRNVLFYCRFDIYRKVPKDLTQPTLTGACISLCSVLFILYLFVSELLAFIIPEMLVFYAEWQPINFRATSSRRLVLSFCEWNFAGFPQKKTPNVRFRTSVLFVEDPTGQKEKIPVFIDVTLPKMKCQCKYSQTGSWGHADSWILFCVSVLSASCKRTTTLTLQIWGLIYRTILVDTKLVWWTAPKKNWSTMRKDADSRRSSNWTRLSHLRIHTSVLSFETFLKMFAATMTGQNYNCRFQGIFTFLRMLPNSNRKILTWRILSTKFGLGTKYWWVAYLLVVK